MNYQTNTVQDMLQQLATKSASSFAHSSSRPSMLKSDKRGYVALLYSGTARSFSANFESHIVNLMAGCPYTVHLFLHTYTNENHSPPPSNHSEDANHLSVNSTLAYFEGYMNLDDERVLFRDAVKANVFEYVPPETLRAIYKDTYDISIKRFPSHPPIPGVYYMWHSQRRSEELRQAYIDENELVYKWTFRMRHDGVYFTNWWQRAFDVTVYDPLNAAHKNISHDIRSDWGVRRTRLYDMVYEPRIQMSNAFYIPFGWSNGGFNDQFAAMSSLNAHHYFMRVLRVNRMLNEAIVHPEASISLIAQWNNIDVDNISATICYDVVRIAKNSQQSTGGAGHMNRSCSYKRSGEEDCRVLCPRLETLNQALRDRFTPNASLSILNTTMNANQIRALLLQHLSRMNDKTMRMHPRSSSFYYFYRYVHPKNVNDPCLPRTWSADQGNNYESYKLPFILRSSDRRVVAQFNKLLTCGASVEVNG